MQPGYVRKQKAAPGESGSPHGPARLDKPAKGAAVKFRPLLDKTVNSRAS